MDDVAPYRAAIDEKLRSAAEVAGKQGVLLLLENELDCNTATGREAARTMNADPVAASLPSTGIPAMPSCAANSMPSPPPGTPCRKTAFTTATVKNAVKNAEGKIEWSPVDKGIIDWTAQFRALKQAGYHDAVSLETHWQGGGTPEESTRICWAGMKQALKDAGAF